MASPALPVMALSGSALSAAGCSAASGISESEGREASRNSAGVTVSLVAGVGPGCCSGSGHARVSRASGVLSAGAGICSVASGTGVTTGVSVTSSACSTGAEAELSCSAAASSASDSRAGSGSGSLAWAAGASAAHCGPSRPAEAINSASVLFAACAGSCCVVAVSAFCGSSANGSGKISAIISGCASG